MRRLYIRLYLAVLASLLVFALAAGFLWRQLGQGSPQFETVASLVQNALPAKDASKVEQQAVLERLMTNLRADVSLFAPDRTLLAAIGAPFPAPRSAGWVRDGGWATQLPDGRWLVARAPHGRRGPGFGLTMFLAVLVAVGVGAYPVVRRLTRRLEQLQSAVESFGAGDLAARVQVKGRDEVARLAEAFNHSAARIEALIGARKSLLANASHELRTPLARIRMGVELMRQSADTKRKRELGQDIAELDALIDEILLASRLDAMKEDHASEEVDLLGLAAEECARYSDAEAQGEALVVRGDPRLLRRMVRNLLENANRHGRPPLRVSVAASGAFAVLEVCDEGPGVAEAERERVFEPFYRRSGSTEGAGLGLALVRQIAERHGGSAICGGKCFTVRLVREVHAPDPKAG